MLVKFKETGEVFAMKSLHKSAIIQKRQIEHTMAERAILEQIQHPFLVELKYAFQTESKLYLVLEFVNGGELFFHLRKNGRFKEDTVRLYVAQLALVLDYLNDHEIVYRDLKPENILLDKQGYIKVTDFGLSKSLPKNGQGDSERATTFAGTPEYMAPEILKGEGYTFPVDWWSLGTLMYEMLYGLPPFYNQNLNMMYHNILCQDLNFNKNRNIKISREAQDLIRGLLIRDPATRFTGKTVKAHPFFKAIDWDKLLDRGYKMPFRPKVKNNTDVSQFDSQFTSEPAQDSYVDPSLLSKADQQAFQNFTFQDESALSSK